jgi:hypothetical protein
MNTAGHDPPTSTYPKTNQYTKTDEEKKGSKLKGVYVWTPPANEKSTVAKKFCHRMVMSAPM